MDPAGYGTQSSLDERKGCYLPGIGSKEQLHTVEFMYQLDPYYYHLYILYIFTFERL